MTKTKKISNAGITENDVNWESDEVVIINGVRLNVRKDRYDWRRN